MRGKILALLAGTAVVLGITVAPAPSATAAANAANFNAGNIISDALFYDGAAMTSAQIQAFLDKQIGKCSSSDCINILRTNISSRAARISDTTGNVVCNAFTGGTNLRVSEVIYRSQVACGISAKVILATLQKEQGLVTSKDPSPHNLNYAMGQACPDTAPCDPAFKGIGVQILAGTTQLKTYKAARFGRQPGTHNILYNPDSSCGSKRVEVKNYATAALYNYTPYTPNAAALATLYGKGNGCSSYGNRNFWRDYTDWFGPTTAGSSTVSTVDTVTHLLGLDASGELWAYPSNGKGGWQTRVSLGTPWAGFRKLFAPGDVDGDGHRDLITVSTSGAAVLRYGDGSLGYVDPLVLDIDPNAPLITAAGDFSGDGIPDVFTTDTAGNLLLWRGTESGTFGSSIKVGNGWSGFDLIEGGSDFSGDGLPDLIGRRMDGTLALYRGNGRGGWLGSATVGNGWNVMTDIFLSEDTNGDGKADVFGVDTTGGLWLYPGSGKGSFGAKAKVGTGWQAMSLVADGGPRPKGARTIPPGLGDLDNDGYRDIIALTKTGELRLYRGNGAGGFLGVTSLQNSVPTGSRFVTLGDFNSDSFPDLGRIDPSGDLWLLAGTAGGGFATPTRIGNGWNVLDLVFGGIDFDGDGRVDVIGRDGTGNLKLYAGDGSGGWTKSGVQIGNGWSGMTAIMPAGDFDGDGHPDVLARTANGALMLYSTNGDGGWRRVVQVGNGWGVFTSVFSPGDFDRSGGSDIVGAKADGSLVLYRTSGKGTWLSAKTINSGWNIMTWIG